MQGPFGRRSNFVSCVLAGVLVALRLYTVRLRLEFLIDAMLYPQFVDQLVRTFTYTNDKLKPLYHLA